MATLTINGKQVTVGDGFLKLSRADQEKTVNEIASQMGVPQKSAIPPYAQALLQAQSTMPPPQEPTPQQQVDSGVEAFRMANHPDLTVGQFNDRLKGSGITDPMNLQQIAQNDQLFGFGDEVSGLAAGTAAALSGKDFGKNYDAGTRLALGRRALGLQQGGIPAQVASVVGNLTSLGSVPSMGAAAQAPGLIRSMATGGATGAVLGGVQGFGSANGDVQDRLQGAQSGAEAGAVVGTAVPAVARIVTAPFSKIATNAAVNAAVKNAPDAADLAAQSGALFRKVDASGVTVDTNKFSQFVNTMVTTAKKMRINPTLDPKATGAYQELIGALSDVQKNGNPLTISDLHTLRQIAQHAAMSTDGRDGMFANRIVDGLDQFVTSSGNLKLPPNQLGSAASTANSAGNDLMDAISTWSRSRKVGLIETAVYKAGNQASGLENGLRTQFRAMLQNDKTRRLFTPVELAAIQDVANGTATSNVVRLIGKFGFGGGTAGNALGGVLGIGAGNVLGGPPGALAAAILGWGARKYSGHLASSAAARAAKIVATPGIPSVPVMPFPAITGTTIPLAIGHGNQ